MTEDAPTRLSAALSGRYRIECEIGAGGMAVVYLAHDLKHDRPVALKVLRPELAAAVGSRRFLAEIRTTANLQHPHILPLFDSGEADGSLYFVMPYVEGESLRQRLERERQLPIEEALRITAEVADALRYAHARGIIHRDIKPANVMLSEGRALVMDFGIAMSTETDGGTRLTSTGMSLGTAGYMSPEQAYGDQPVDHRTDIYSLGALLFEMLTGEPPYSGRSVHSILARQITSPVPSARALRPAVPSAVDQVIARALATNSADRFGMVEDVVEALTSSPEVQQRAPGEPMSILVLPFANRSPDPDQEYLSDGLTEELITDLSKIRSLRVISRNSAMLLKGPRRTHRPSPGRSASAMCCRVP